MTHVYSMFLIASIVVLLFVLISLMEERHQAIAQILIPFVFVLIIVSTP